MKTLLFILPALLIIVQCDGVKKLGSSHHSLSKHQLEKEASNKIYHGPTYKKALTDEEFARKKARYYKKLRLGHKGEHRLANTRHDQDDLSLQSLDASTARTLEKTQHKHKPTNFNKVMKLKSLKPSKKADKMYKKLLAKEKMRMKKKHFKKQKKQMVP